MGIGGEVGQSSSHLSTTASAREQNGYVEESGSGRGKGQGNGYEDGIGRGEENPYGTGAGTVGGEGERGRRADGIDNNNDHNVNDTVSVNVYVNVNNNVKVGDTVDAHAEAVLAGFHFDASDFDFDVDFSAESDKNHKGNNTGSTHVSSGSDGNSSKNSRSSGASTSTDNDNDTNDGVSPIRSGDISSGGRFKRNLSAAYSGAETEGMTSRKTLHALNKTNSTRDMVHDRGSSTSCGRSRKNKKMKISVSPKHVHKKQTLRQLLSSSSLSSSTSSSLSASSLAPASLKNKPTFVPKVKGTKARSKSKKGPRIKAKKRKRATTSVSACTSPTSSSSHIPASASPSAVFGAAGLGSHGGSDVATLAAHARALRLKKGMGRSRNDIRNVPVIHQHHGNKGSDGSISSDGSSRSSRSGGGGGSSYSSSGLGGGIKGFGQRHERINIYDTINNNTTSENKTKKSDPIDLTRAPRSKSASPTSHLRSASSASSSADKRYVDPSRYIPDSPSKHSTAANSRRKWKKIINQTKEKLTISVEEKRSKQQKLFAAARRRFQDRKNIERVHENAEREELARLYTPPSFFREEMADSPYTTQEREEAVAFVLQHADKRPKVCLCFGANNAMFSTSSSVTNGGKKKLVSKHYRRLALLVHPDKHKSSNNKTGGYGTRSGRRGGKAGDTGEMEKKASDAFNLLHAAYQKVLKMV